MIGILVIVLSVVVLCNSQQTPKCEEKQTCGECIQEFGCVWCIKPNNISNSDRPTHCMSDSYVDNSDWCPGRLLNPQSSQEILQDEQLTSHTNKVIQIQPQRIKLKIRKGEERTVTFKYRQAENYPVDLYYIMDLSASMKEHKEKLAKLGDVLVHAMRDITNNFKLGFGSFVDKVDLPYVSTVPEKLEKPCSECAAPYSFINHLSLTNQTNKFSMEVRGANVSGNLDSPEGGFDALMQAIVCKKVIGWRKEARHLIVFSTDADFHIAGDGKLAGIVEPNDAICHMENGKYVADLIYDYPSISQINYVAKQNNINIIFAIVRKNTNTVYNKYETLHRSIENSGVGALNEKSDNVVDLIKENYNKIADTVKIANSKTAIEIKYTSNCTKPIPSGCNEVHVGETIQFTATIKALDSYQCSEKVTEVIKIKPEAISADLTIELEVFCDCDCEHAGNADNIPNSDDCSNLGNLTCGVCNCQSGRIGSKCECLSSSTNTENSDACKAPNATEACSGFGTCDCGECKCNDGHTGKYCQCSDTTCLQIGGKLCSGSDHGKCECGICKCLNGWGGETCECRNSNDTCINPDSPDGVCSGQGSCECGECSCNHPYNGQYCQDCPTCPGRCEELKPCVECKVFKSGKYNDNECELKCASYDIITKDKIDEDNIPANVKLCTAYDHDNCKFIYQYEYNSKDQLIVTAQKLKICNQTNVLAWVLGLIGTIVLAGLILLAVWKIFTTIHDKREYAKFENERANSKWQRGENPLYKPTISNFQNPMYQK